MRKSALVHHSMMFGDESSPNLGRRFSANAPPIRTYSRRGRGLKRSFTSLSKPLSQSEHATTAGIKGLIERRSDSEPYSRFKRKSRSDSSGMRPTDLFWEHLSAPISLSLRPQRAHHPEINLPTATDQRDLDIVYMTPDEEPPNPTLDSKVGKKLAPMSGGTHDQQSRATRLNPVVPANSEQHEDKYVAVDSGDDPLQRDPLEETIFTPYHKDSIEGGTLLSRVSSSASRKLKNRRYQDIDESLSAVESSPASARRPLMPRKKLATTSDFDEAGGTGAPKKAGSRHSVDGFGSLTGSSSDGRKHAGLKEYKEVKAATNTRPKRPSDGFRRDEARTGFLGKKRRVETSDVSIGPLETTQKGRTSQKMEGPTWQRGQKKSKVSTSRSLWKGRQYFGSSQFQIELEESPDELDNERPTSPVKVTRFRSRRRIGRIMEEDELSVVLPSFPGEVDENNNSALNDAGVTRPSSQTEGSAPYSNNDADEPLNLLVFPSDTADEASFTIPRTDTPEPSVSVAQLPPKRWVLNRQRDEQGKMSLRPNPTAWERQASVIPETSDL